jgi:MoaA/NifB/PqqE/SkfB family radical SAM enzyme
MIRVRLAQAYRLVSARLGRPMPVYAHYGVTHRCNMRCRMCAVWTSGNAATELTPPQVERLARNLWAAGVRSIALGGGEPFVRRDLPGLVAAFGRLGFDIRLLTNGVAVSDARLAEVVAAGVRHVSISLDSLDPKKEAFIYGDREVWDEIVGAMRRVRPFLPSGAIPILNACVSRLNLDELPDLVRLADSLGFYASFVPISLAPAPEAGDGFAAHAPDLAVRPEDHPRVESAYAELLRLKRRGAPIANSSRFLRDSLAFLKSGSCRWTCDAGRLYFSVSPEGDIAICHRYPALARWDSDDLPRLLREPETRRLAARQRAECPGCMRPCWAEVSHAVHDWRGMLEAARLVGGAGRRRMKAEG